jgi:MYXO-CTERM domain-containing protein
VAPADDAGAMVGEDAFVAGEDAGMVVEDDAAIAPGTDAGTAVMDAGRRDGGGAGLDAAGSGLPPSSGGCACRVEGGSDRGLASSLAALVGLALLVGRRRARGARRG